MDWKEMSLDVRLTMVPDGDGRYHAMTETGVVAVGDTVTEALCAIMPTALALMRYDGGTVTASLSTGTNDTSGDRLPEDCDAEAAAPAPVGVSPVMCPWCGHVVLPVTEVSYRVSDAHPTGYETRSMSCPDCGHEFDGKVPTDEEREATRAALDERHETEEPRQGFFASLFHRNRHGGHGDAEGTEPIKGNDGPADPVGETGDLAYAADEPDETADGIIAADDVAGVSDDDTDGAMGERADDAYDDADELTGGAEDERDECADATDDADEDAETDDIRDGAEADGIRDAAETDDDGDADEDAETDGVGDDAGKDEHDADVDSVADGNDDEADDGGDDDEDAEADGRDDVDDGLVSEEGGSGDAGVRTGDVDERRSGVPEDE